MSEIPMYPDQCEHGASRPDLCGHCQLIGERRQSDVYRKALEEIRDMMGPKNRERFVMQGIRSMVSVYNVVEKALAASLATTP